MSRSTDTDDIVEVMPATGVHPQPGRWQDVAWVPADRVEKITSRIAKPVPPPVVVEPPVLYQAGKIVYTKPGMFYWKDSNGRMRHLAHTRYTGGHEEMTEHEAKGFMLGETPVFCYNDEAVRQAKALLEKIDITRIVPNSHLCFFPDERGYFGGDATDVFMLIYTNNMLRIKRQWNSPDVLKFDNPMAIDEATYFHEISNFITRASRGVRTEVQNAKRQLNQVKERRTEDVFIHISDLTPPPGKEELHQFVLSRFEEEYQEDQLQLKTWAEQLAKQQAQLKAARSQLPAGIKGKRIRTNYYQSPVLREYLDYFDIGRDNNYLRLDMRYAKDLVVDGISYGRPRIHITLTPDRGNGRDGTFIYRVVAYSRDKNKFVHPHLQGTERWCLGTYVKPLQNAILGGNLPLVTTLLWRYLTEYNPGSPLVRIETCRAEMADVAQPEIIVRRK